MNNFDDITIEKMNKHNPNWPMIFPHLYQLLIIGGYESGKTIAFLNLISHQHNLFFCTKNICY